jgi:hypothetical protein
VTDAASLARLDAGERATLEKIAGFWANLVWEPSIFSLKPSLLLRGTAFFSSGKPVCCRGSCAVAGGSCAVAGGSFAVARGSFVLSARIVRRRSRDLRSFCGDLHRCRRDLHTLSSSGEPAALEIVAELAGAEACAWAGLASPAVGLTTFPPALDEAMERAIAALDPATQKEVADIFRVNAGRVAFCCRYLESVADLMPEAIARLPQHRSRLVADAVALGIADAFMLHTDREAENPNALWFAGRIVAIDHNLAFAPLARAGSTGAALAGNVVPTRAPFLRHVAAGIMREHAGEVALWDGPVARLEAVPDAAIAALVSHWPAELDAEPSRSITGIRGTFESFLQHRRAFVRETVENLRAMLTGAP